MFICAHVYLGRSMGMGVRAQSWGARAQLGVCIHDLCGLYTEGRKRNDLPSPQVEILLIAMHDDSIQEMSHYLIYGGRCIALNIQSGCLFYSCNLEFYA